MHFLGHEFQKLAHYEQQIDRQMQPNAFPRRILNDFVICDIEKTA